MSLQYELGETKGKDMQQVQGIVIHSQQLARYHTSRTMSDIHNRIQHAALDKLINRQRFSVIYFCEKT